MDNCFKSNEKSNETKINARKYKKKECSRNKVKTNKKRKSGKLVQIQ